MSILSIILSTTVLLLHDDAYFVNSESLRGEIRLKLETNSEFDFLGTVTFGEISDNDVSDVWDSVQDSFSDAGNSVGHWVSGAYADSESGMKSFLNDANNAIKTIGNRIDQNFIEPVDKFSDKSMNYFKSDFVGDVKDIANTLKDALTDICTFPGAVEVAKFTCAQALEVGMCAATTGATCAKKVNKDMLETISTKASGKLLRNMIKCTSFDLLKMITQKKLCDGRLDFISDTLADGALGQGYDMVCNTAIECLCGTCPTSCSYSNRALCDGSYWLSFGLAGVDAVNSANRTQKTSASVTPHTTTSVVKQQDLLSRNMYTGIRALSNGKYVSIVTSTMIAYANSDSYRFDDSSISEANPRNTFRLISDSTNRYLFSNDRYRFLQHIPNKVEVYGLRSESYSTGYKRLNFEIVRPGVVKIQSLDNLRYWRVESNGLLTASGVSTLDGHLFEFVELTKGAFNDRLGGLSILKAHLGVNESNGTDKTREIVDYMLKNKVNSFSSSYKLFAGKEACRCASLFPQDTWPMQCFNYITIIGGIQVPIPAGGSEPRCPSLMLFITYVRNSGLEKTIRLGPFENWINLYQFQTTQLT